METKKIKGDVEIKGVIRPLILVDFSGIKDKELLRVMWFDEQHRRVTSFLKISDIFLKILNAQSESLNVSSDEHQEKVCPNCDSIYINHKVEEYFECNTCGYEWQTD